MSNKDTILKYAKEALIDELYSTEIYKKLAKLYRDEKISRKLLENANMENRHSKFWLKFLQKRNANVKNLTVNKLKVNLYTILFKLLGMGLTLRMLEAGEREAIRLYATMLENPGIDEEEKEAIKKIMEDELIHEYGFMEEESKFKDFINHVRDAVLGMSDGLVEVLSVSTGLAGVYGDPTNVALGGLIVGIAGALSMGIGVFSSVRAQRQVRLSILSRIKLAAKYVAHVFSIRVVQYMRKKQISSELAEKIAEEAAYKKDLLGRIIAEEEYGLREEALENPVKAGLYTGSFYIIGAMVPLIPYFLSLPINLAIPISLILAALMLAITGFMIALSADLDIKKKMLELIITGLGSAILTFLIGKIASILIGIEVT